MCCEEVDTRGRPLQLNAYVIDFYNKPHMYSLVRANKLTDGKRLRRKKANSEQEPLFLNCVYFFAVIYSSFVCLMFVWHFSLWVVVT